MPDRDRALAAVLEVAAEAGVHCTEPAVLRDQSNLLVHLSPAPVVARLAWATATMRDGPAWLSREVAVAAFLTATGAPVVAPSDELAPGPHERDGFVFSFWQFVP